MNQRMLRETLGSIMALRNKIMIDLANCDFDPDTKSLKQYQKELNDIGSIVKDIDKAYDILDKYNEHLCPYCGRPLNEEPK